MTLETATSKDKEIPFDKLVALDDEVRASINLIHSGLAELQNINGGNDFYYLPFNLLSNGFEKLLKLIICFYHWEQYGQFPTMDDFKKSKKDNGHNLLYLKDKVTADYFVASTPALKDDLDTLTNNPTLNQLVDFLGEFGQYSRYYNLDVIISNPKQKSKDIKQLWERLETDLLLADKELFDKFKDNHKDIDKTKLDEIRKINDQVRTKTIVLLEIFARALTRQFTFGKLGQAQRFTGTIRTFLFLNDSDLGQRDYRELKK
ncbi:hypothetical protein SAMN06295967_101283 [Belliella buryatensis]|uniref:Uncharacterized protein n=1 Tax=Belliella buryatensis TaxID=1500549 RepID=A0A239AN57_9BACT|nr:hypothetical protein [Belliella buryatensis]SNR96989.1 hypothetical protein SAMN06295967_101283 [Belliella buryatensis]